ncbi:hypothetical protein [Silanimonas sp.]|jgi:hypothetical protein|uniref:hypothetical protein n=1 Tax=Silanimonas sp. TaxID=1929290 RepID=UPI0037CAA8C6
MRITRLALAAALLAALPAAAFAEEVAEGALQLTDKQTFLLPIDEPGNRLPAYPAEVLAQQQVPSRAICMRVDIDEEGAVSYTGPLVREPECPAVTELSKQFVDVSVAALSSWRFEPAVVCTFRTKDAKEAAGMSCEGGREKPQATSLTFRLLFNQVDGKGVVLLQRG